MAERAFPMQDTVFFSVLAHFLGVGMESRGAGIESTFFFLWNFLPLVSYNKYSECPPFFISQRNGNY